MYWSAPVSFGWFFKRKWEYEYGKDWAMQICQEWYDYDGRRENFFMELEPKGLFVFLLIKLFEKKLFVF